MEIISTPPPAFPDGQPEDQQPKWRQDFPIDVEADEYGARRDFTKFLVLTSLAFACGQLWIAMLSLFRRRTFTEQRVVALDELPIGSVFSFHYPTDRDPCLLIRTSAEEFKAYSSLCTHLMCPVLPQLRDNQLHCPCHEGFFEVATGRPTAGPPRRPLSKITINVRDGVVYAVDVEARTS
ncbi:MAG: ubiquinol-cytochrome c reductase iron-sulfur subunit [Planctomycetaceae bacterium]